VSGLVLNRIRVRLSRHFYYPPLVIVALTVIYTEVIATLLFGV
jgi:hypothetical protein